jgi:putative nucleotidyltransferase with HDIG domain
MSVEAIDNAERTRDSNEQRERPLSPDLRRAELLGGAAYLILAGALALVAGVDSFSLWTASVYVIAIAIASNVRFDFGAGFTVPTQAVFVPMLFAVPVAVVPLLTLLALVLGMLPAVLRGRIAPSWMLTAPGNSWFAIGPAFVLALAGEPGPDSSPAILVLALAAQFAVDFVAAAVRDRLFGDEVPISELAQEVAPIYALDVALSSLGLVVALAVVEGYGSWPVILIAPLFLVLRVFSRERQERLEQLAELNDAYQGTALLLGDVVEADDSYTGEHSKSVVRLALDVAEALGLSQAQTRNVEFGALLHDVGKLAVPNEIINKPGKLNEREWEIVKTHTIEGEKMLARIGGFMTEIGTIVRASHEHWDGSGYPDGLRGEEIPVEARVVCACDAFNAMTTTRSYRRAMRLGDAIAEMERCAGTQFDPRVVEALLELVRGSQEEGERPALEPAANGAHPVVPADPSAPQLGASWGASRNADVIQALAELAVSVGANVQPGQHVEVSGETGHLETVRAIVAAAYARGAEFVDVELSDPLVQAARIGAAPQESLDHVPGWEAQRVRDLAARGGASILVTGPTYPGLFDGLDPRRVALASQGPSAEWRDATRAINWTIVPGATEGWAAELRPQLPIDEALAALWADIANICRLDMPFPRGAWEERLADLRDRAAWLTAQELRAVRFEGPGTDLTIGLMEGVRWERAEMITPGGVAFVPNLPTEEVYTTPDSARVDGHVRLTRPVVIGGSRIPDVSLRFQEGRVVEIDGPPEAEALREFVARDRGAARLGELALVDADSRVAHLGQTFGEILLDENATSHIALGYGFPALIPSSSRQTANASDHHLDLMIGSPEVEVSGVDRRGSLLPLLREGAWVGARASAATASAGC